MAQTQTDRATTITQGKTSEGAIVTNFQMGSLPASSAYNFPPKKTAVGGGSISEIFRQQKEVKENTKSWITQHAASGCEGRVNDFYFSVPGQKELSYFHYVPNGVLAQLSEISKSEFGQKIQAKELIKELLLAQN